MKQEHIKYMEVALDLARSALSTGNPPVGALLISNGKIIGKGIESGKSSGDITNHAEILAIRDAISGGSQQELSISTLYTTHEPCIMCSYVIRYHKISQVIYGVSVDHVGGFSSDFDVLSTEKIPKWGNSPVIKGGVLASECAALSEQFSILLKR